jgi:hypothetical protein
MKTFSRSWRITKLSFSVIGKDKEMLLFPILAGIFSTLYTLLLLFPSGVLEFVGSDSVGAVSFGILQYAMVFLTYLGLSFIATFCNVCVVYTTKIRFEGGDATFMESIRFGFSKVGVIFQWSLVSATIGLIFLLLDRLAERVGGIGEIILNLVRSLLGVIWSIVTLFVVPTLVFEDVTPIEAIKKSSEIIKKTWGENLVAHYGMGLMQFLAGFCLIAISIGLAMVIPSETGTIFALGFGIISLIFMTLVFNVAKMVFQTALYVYASTGTEPDMFEGETLASAFGRKNAV